jgi:hypothetical protein
MLIYLTTYDWLMLGGLAFVLLAYGVSFGMIR